MQLRLRARTQAERKGHKLGRWMKVGTTRTSLKTFATCTRCTCSVIVDTRQSFDNQLAGRAILLLCTYSQED